MSKHPSNPDKSFTHWKIKAKLQADNGNKLAIRKLAKAHALTSDSMTKYHLTKK